MLKKRGSSLRTLLPLTGPYPSVWLDAKYLKIREGDRVLSMASVVATGVNAQA